MAADTVIKYPDAASIKQLVGIRMLGVKIIGGTRVVVVVPPQGTSQRVEIGLVSTNRDQNLSG